MNTQRRRLAAETVSNALINGKDSITIELSEGPSVNVHGLRYCASIEPENTDANANGFWIVYCLPADIIQAADLPDGWAALDDEDFLPYVWGVGCWTASNQAPANIEFNPRTSRTCQNGARLFAYVSKSGISAGNVRVNQTMTCFTSN